MKGNIRTLCKSIFWVICVLGVIKLEAQVKATTITTDDFNKEGNALVINFKLPSKLQYTYDIGSAAIYSRKFGLIEMKTIRGEQRDLLPGRTYKLYWEVLQDVDEFDAPEDARINLVYTATSLKKMETEFFQSSRTVRDYEEYLRIYPNGKHADEAKRKINSLKKEVADLEAWGNAEEKHTIEAYRNYLKRYPNGMYVTDANNAIKNIKTSTRKSKRPYVTVGLSGRFGWSHIPFVTESSSIENVPVDFEEATFFENFAYAYSLGGFTELRITDKSYLYLGGAFAGRKFRYAPKIDRSNIRTLTTTDFRFNAGFNFDHFFIGGYYVWEVQNANIEVDGITVDLKEDHPDFLTNDYGITIGVESRPKKSYGTTGYLTNNLVLGIGYDLSLAGLLEEDYNGKGTVDSAFGVPNMRLGVAYLKIGVRF